MVTSSSADAVPFSFGFLPPVTEKLTHGNYAMWLAQVTSTLQGARLWKFTRPTSKPPSEFLEVDAVDENGKKADSALNPEYEQWFAKDS